MTIWNKCRTASNMCLIFLTIYINPVVLNSVGRYLISPFVKHGLKKWCSTFYFENIILLFFTWYIIPPSPHCFVTFTSIYKNRLKWWYIKYDGLLKTFCNVSRKKTRFFFGKNVYFTRLKKTSCAFLVKNYEITKLCVFAKAQLTVCNMGNNYVNNWSYRRKFQIFGFTWEFYPSDNFQFVGGGVQPKFIDFLF